MINGEDNPLNLLEVEAIGDRGDIMLITMSWKGPRAHPDPDQPHTPPPRRDSQNRGIIGNTPPPHNQYVTPCRGAE